MARSSDGRQLTSPVATAAAASPPVLTIPGLCCSGPDHWQTRWEESRPGCRRIELPDWDDPRPEAWAAAVGTALDRAATPVLVAAHSLGCHALVHWALRSTRDAAGRVAGALLVAPPDAEAPGVDPRIARFAPVPIVKLPFPARLLASGDDPYATLGASAGMAERWGADLVNVGLLGHINAASRLGTWPQGQELAGLTVIA